MILIKLCKWNGKNYVNVKLSTFSDSPFLVETAFLNNIILISVNVDITVKIDQQGKHNQ
ncbi:hypothetical protein PIROE2DRAFT_9893 [Piromyces sp. E2]|nr:hypothetical protein PIROE2DRAFT_9893 [Piromyces sp. E2]|eukprot:OUM63541.1 hypothetical protein PIROE2DRAFT_9893 [Piromyces sp. E2]